LYNIIYQNLRVGREKGLVSEKLVYLFDIHIRRFSKVNLLYEAAPIFQVQMPFIAENLSTHYIVFERYRYDDRQRVHKIAILWHRSARTIFHLLIAHLDN
jgi:hypothetical protein